jgi:hypothetical protein
MHSTVWNRLVRAGALVAIGAFGLATVAAAKPAPRPGRRALNLFASSGLLLQANRLQCGVDNVGQVCVAFSGSPVGGGGFWPKGTPDQYIFNSGLQLAGVVNPAISGFAWAGDTAGAFFFDPRGDQGAGDALGQIYNSLDPGDLDAWPAGAMVRDAAIYNPVLLGQKKISDGDSWVRYWEGNPTQLGGREHPMGIMVEQRSMSWNFPVGNEDILYFVFTFYNVTARTPAVYSGLDPSIRSDVADIGARFQDLNETKFGIQIPDSGYTLTSLYAAFGMDADVAVFNQNYGTAFLPFNIGSIYSGTFLPEVGWVFPSSIFGPPFFPGAGFIGVKYLKSPEDTPGHQVGLTLFGMTTNSSQFPDAVGDHLLYRRLSGYLGASDNPCSPFTNPATARLRRLCYLAQIQDDARFYQASGPFSLAPGQSQTIVVAYINAAPVATPGVVQGGDTKPGVPFTGDSIAANPATHLRPIDRVAGWAGQSDANGDNIIEQNEVVTTPRSLLNKALVAQAVFDAKFLLPNAPASPQFFLVPGDNQVTVVWQKSETETAGDLYFNIASKPFNIDSVTGDSTQNALYDPNFRKFDVEGYRIYRGRTSSDLQLVAQFDYSGTQFIDYTGAVQYGDLNGDGIVQCAPELGLEADCPVPFDTSFVKTVGFPTELSGQLVQVKAGERIELKGEVTDTIFKPIVDTTVSPPDTTGTDTLLVVRHGGVLNIIADTAVTGRASGFPPLSNTGVSFAFTDNNVRNGFTYHYSVTAFDVNSVKSGPSSLESTRITKTATPRAGSGQEVAGVLAPQELLSASGTTLPSSSAEPVLDAATGKFTTPMPPTNGIQVGLASFLPQLLGNGSLTVKIDSIQPGMQEEDVAPGLSRDAVYYLTGQGAGAPVHFVIPIQPAQGFAGSILDTTVSAAFEATAIDSAKSARFGGNPTFSLFGQTSITIPGVFRINLWGRADANGEPSGSTHNGPRWWAGAANENTDDPNGGTCTPSTGACNNTVKVPNLKKTGGQIAGVDIAPLMAYLTVASTQIRVADGALATVARAADIHVKWGAAGAIDSVFDDTHGVPVPFDTRVGASWGILNQASFAATPQASTPDGKNGLLTWTDALCPAPLPRYTGLCSGVADTLAPVLQNTAALSPIAFRDSASSQAGTAAAGYTATGDGFIFYLTGHFYLMQMAALPAAGTVWHVRTYSGVITGAPGSYLFAPDVRPPSVPGLRVRVAYTGSTFSPATTTAQNLDRIHTLPDPYYVSNALENTANQKVLQFVNLPAQAVVRIYSVSGVLVNVLTHNDPTGGGLLTWNLRNRNNQFVASGVYFYHVEAPDGQTKVGRFTVVNFAP